MGVFKGGSAADLYRGTSGRDVAKGGSGDDYLLGAADDDRLYGGVGDDRLRGGNDDDLLRGGSGNDSLGGDAGDDSLLGENGDDLLRGGLGDDRLRGGSGNDSLGGDAGDDSLLGEKGDDALRGGLGNDLLRGGYGDDVLKGDGGDDRLDGESGDDILTGGSGADLFVVARRLAGMDTVTDFRLAQGDRLDLSGALGRFDFGDDLAGFVRFTVESTGTRISIDPLGRGEHDEEVLFLKGVKLGGLRPAEMSLESLPDRTTLVSIDDEGGRDAGSGPGLISADGRYVAFQSSDTKLGSDVNDAADIYLRDMLTGRVVHVSTDAEGQGADASATSPTLAANGRHLLFESTAGNLDPDDDDALNDLFWVDSRTDAVQRVNETADGERFGFDGQGISANGRYVVFETLESLAPGDSGGFDIYLRDMVTGDFTRVSTKADGGAPNSGSIDPSLSADGRFVAFTSLATNLTGGGDAFTDFDVFVKNLQTGEVERISRDSQGGEPDAESGKAVLSADGRFVLFESHATDLVAGDVDNGEAHLFWFDRETDTMLRVSEAADGTPSNGFDVDADVSVDGRFVVFSSNADNLVGGDDNGRFDIFVKDMTTGEVARVNTGTGSNLGGMQRPDISDDGSHIVFDGSGDVVFALNPLLPRPDLTSADLLG